MGSFKSRINFQESKTLSGHRLQLASFTTLNKNCIQGNRESGGLIYISWTLQDTSKNDQAVLSAPSQRSVTISPLDQNVSLCSCSSVFSGDCLFSTSVLKILTVSYDGLANGLALDFGFDYDVPDPTGHQTPYHRYLDVTYWARSHPDTAESFLGRHSLRN